MNRSILSRGSYNVKNDGLEEMVAECQEVKNDLTKLRVLIELLEKSQVIIPVSFPKNASPVVVMKMLKGEPLKKNESIKMAPVIVKDSEGHKLAPVFTSRDKIQDTKDFPFMIRIPAAAVIASVKNDKAEYTGMIINPQGKGLVINRKAFEDDLAAVAARQAETQGQMQLEKTPQLKKVTKSEFNVLARNSVEKVQLPKALFEDGAAFVKELDERGEEFLCEHYSKPYGDKVPSPFTAEDFNVLSLNIDDETMAYIIELPTKGKGMAPHVAVGTYIVWNPVAGKAYYYMVERGEKGEPNVLCSVTPDGHHEELMTAPPTGSELTAVLDLIREED